MNMQFLYRKSYSPDVAKHFGRQSVTRNRTLTSIHNKLEQKPPIYK